MRWTPSAPNISPTTDLPLAIPPVRPTFSKCSSRQRSWLTTETRRKVVGLQSSVSSRQSPALLQAFLTITPTPRDRKPSSPQRHTGTEKKGGQVPAYRKL